MRRGYELYAAGDLEGVARLFAEEAEVPGAGGIGISGMGAGRYHGPEGFLRATEEVLEAFEDYAIEAEEFIEAGDAVVVRARVSGRGRSSEAMMETRIAHLWFLRDGKVIRGEVHRTTEEALKAARA